MSQRILITGTSSGIGLDTAVLLAEKGFDVVATMRNLDKRGALDAAAEKAKVGLEMRRLDVADLASISECIGGVEKDLGPIDGLVNNAGFGCLGSVEQLGNDELQHVMNTNFFGVWNTTRAVLPAMRQRGSGRVVTVTSIGGLIGQPFNDAYCAAKFAVEGMMESLAPVARELGLHVSVVQPGPVHTEFVDRVRALSAELLSNGAPGYEKLIGAYAAATGDTFANHGQSGRDIGEVIHAALTDETPHLRYITSDYAKSIAALKYTDPTGDGVVDLFQGRLRGDA